jgi:flagellar hook assembly protein FlgD
LLPNVPNPFNPSTELRFELDRPGIVELNIYDARGFLVRSLIAGHYAAGLHRVMWDGADRAGRPAASGVYQVRLVTSRDGKTEIRTRSVTLVE